MWLRKTLQIEVKHENFFNNFEGFDFRKNAFKNLWAKFQYYITTSLILRTSRLVGKSSRHADKYN